ncbi:MAG TPA: right-handed parallel beta-helix repeat-containing protein [Armatimonadota bacterium]|jgi:predicted outer membrane repeat protein
MKVAIVARLAVITISPVPLVCAMSGASAAAVIYVNVNTSGPHDGAAWRTAFLTIQDGIRAAGPGDEVWVAQGKYSGPLTLKDGVGLYGGFVGKETTRDARNPAVRVTTVRGSGGSVVTIPATAGPDAIIDGFSIRGGLGTLVGVDSWGYADFAGGGICCFGSATISHNVIAGNFVAAGSKSCGGAGQYACLAGGGWGGGIYCGGGSPTISANVIRQNLSETSGGGIYCDGGAPLIDGNAITGNNACSARWTGSVGGFGAGITCVNSYAFITGNNIEGNGDDDEPRYGGGIYSTGGYPTISGNTISLNRVACGGGGGIYLDGGVCSGNFISGNQAWGCGGGGVYATGAAIVVGNTIDSNEAMDTVFPQDGPGGGVYADAGTIVASNLFTNNRSLIQGGGCYAVDAGVINNTFVHNAAVDGGALALSSLGRAVNNLITQNSSGITAADANPSALARAIGANDVIANAYASAVPGARAYEYGGGLPDLTGSFGNIAAVPAFANASAGDYRLQAGSPGIDAGDDGAFAWPTDLDGKPRTIGERTDIGAFEYGAAGPAKVIYVNKNAMGVVRDGTSWATALISVQAAIDSASCRDEVWVAGDAQGAVYEGSVTLKNGVAAYGGFAGFETLRSQRNPARCLTVLAGNAVTAPADIAETARMEGFTIRASGGISIAGRAALANDTVNGDGSGGASGISVSGMATISNCSISGFGGSGISVSGSAVISNATIAANHGATGGISIAGGSATITNTIIAFNETGVVRSGGAVTLRNCDVFGNAGDNYNGLADPTGSDGNLSSDPMFLGRGAADFRLEAGSPCIDAGDDSAALASATDLDAKPRFLGAHTDIGAFEFNGVFVNQNAVGDVHDGASWATAYLTVPEALAAASPGQEIWVAASTYKGGVTLTGRLAMYGGFEGTETRRSQRDPATNVTILDGGEPVVGVSTSLVDEATLDGFTVRNGARFASGGGICIEGRAAIVDCIVTDNVVYSDPYAPDVDAQSHGSGIYVSSGSVTIANSVISDNKAMGGSGAGGGGISIGGGTATLTNNDISRNDGGGFDTKGSAVVVGNTVCDNGGTGIYVYARATIDGNTVTGNGYLGIVAAGAATVTNNVVSGNAYGGIRTFGTAAIANNLVSANSRSDGGGIQVWSGTAAVTNNTVSGNEGASGGGLSIKGDAAVSVVNTILSFNSTGVYLDTGSVTFRNCDAFSNGSVGFAGVPDPTGTAGNFSADPLFVNPASGDFRLTPGSPCIDSGDDSVVAAGEVDLDKRPRVTGSHVDVGAYEHESSVYSLADAAQALRLAGGLSAVPSNAHWWDVEPAGASVDLRDAVRIARKAVGLDSNS